MKFAMNIIAPVIAMFALLYFLSTLAFGPQTIDVEKQTKDDAMINTILKNLLESTGADRSYLFQFHNGTHNGGREFIFYSNTHEICRAGVSSEMLRLQRLPISILATWLPRMEKESAFFLAVNQESHPQSRLILEEQGIKAVAIAKIVYFGKIIGFVGVDFTKYVPTIIDMGLVKEAASIIQPLLTVEKNRKWN